MDYDNIINKLERLPWILEDNSLICYLPNNKKVFETYFNNTCSFFIYWEGKEYRVKNKDILSWATEKLIIEKDKKEEELFNIVINKFQNKFLGPYR